MKRIWKQILRALCLMLGIFTFTACYGVPQEIYEKMQQEMEEKSQAETEVQDEPIAEDALS